MSQAPHGTMRTGTIWTLVGRANKQIKNTGQNILNQNAAMFVKQKQKQKNRWNG